MLSVAEQTVVDVVHEQAPQAMTLQKLDRIATEARTTKDTWRACENVIHKRNLRLLGKDGVPAIYRKGSTMFTVWDGWASGCNRIRYRFHARGLCESGFRYVPQGNLWRKDNE